MRVATMRSLSSVLALVLGLTLHAAPAKRGWTKLELIDPQQKLAPVPEDLLRGHGAETVADYGAFSVIRVPEAAVQGLTKAAHARGWVVRRRDEFDVLRLPRASIDTREGIRDAPFGGLIGQYPPGKRGLFVIQLAGPPRREWIETLQRAGWTLARYVPANGYIAIGHQGLRAMTSALPYVQWVDAYHPYQKSAFFERDGGERALVFDLPTDPELDETIGAIQNVAHGPIRVARGASDTLVHATMSPGAAERLLHQQLVIGISAQTTGELADERQVMSLTSNLDSNQEHPLTSSPTTYWSWVTASSRCPDCTSMSAATWQISIADSGLDDGAPGTGHADLAGRVTNGGLFATNTQCTGHCDWVAHGTFVAGIAAGNNATLLRDRFEPGDDDPDNLGWYLGTGVAPLAGILVTKVTATSVFSATASDVQDWIYDAGTRGVTIQNQSLESGGTPDPSGRYTLMSRAYDLAVRDSNGSASGRPEVLVTIAAGNVNSNPNSHYVATGAVAKNVLTVSGTESSRPFTVSDGCPTATGFRDIMSRSRMGTHIAGYIKPDLVAPATSIVSAHTTIRDQSPLNYCIDQIRGHYDGDSNDANDDEYGILEAGTSFAAPIAAGAALIVKRHLGSTPQATSPAATKAMLIAGAQSIRGGEDHTTHPEFPGTGISGIPSRQQGFGRVSFEEILTGATKPFWRDQSVARTFTETGQIKVARLKARSAGMVKVALVWSDAPGNPAPDNPDPTPLVNDLNLEIRPAGGTAVYLGNRMTTEEQSTAYGLLGPFDPDDVNNVEIGRVTLSANQELDVAVKAQTIAGDTDGNVSTWEQDFAIAALNADLVSEFTSVAPPEAPANVEATASGTTVNITWSTVSGATSYVVQRKTGPTPWETILPPVTATSTTDGPSSASGVVLYRVIALNSGTQSSPSSADVAFVGTFTEGTNVSVPSGLAAKAEHVTDIRAAIDALRQIGGQTAIYTAQQLDPEELRGEVIDDSEWTTLMNNLATARLGAGMASGWAFRTTGPDPDSDEIISHTHLEDLRLGFR